MRRTERLTTQRGFSLIEVLVAVLIVSVGVLGVAGLQLVSLQNNTSAVHRTVAFQLAYDVLDRARANPVVDYSVALGDDPSVAVDCDDPLRGDTACESGTCSAPELRQYDLNRWLWALSCDLPEGDGAVAVLGNELTVTIQWQDDRDGAPPVEVAVSTAIGT